MTDAPTPSTAKTVPLNEAVFAVQLVVMATVPLFHVVFLDWDAGMVAGLLAAETVAVWLTLPILWTVVDWRWHQVRRHAAELDTTAPEDASDAPPGDHSASPRAPARFFLVRKLAANTALVVFVALFGGVLPLILLLVQAPNWLEWIMAYAEHTLGMHPAWTLVLWPFLLASQVTDLWPTYGISLIAIVLVVLAQLLSVIGQAVFREVDPGELEDDAQAQMANISVPLFFMAAMALAIGGWVSERRELPIHLAGRDPMVWSMVALLVLRSLMAGLGRAFQQSERARARGDRAAWKLADHSLATLAVGGFAGIALIFGGILLVTSPRPTSAPPTRDDCLARWTGGFAPETRAAFTNWDDAWSDDAEVACERLASATSLRLNTPVAPDDLAYFHGLVRIELRGEALALLPHLDLLPSLTSLMLVTDGPVDLTTLPRHVPLREIVIEGGTLDHAERLWTHPGLERLVLSGSAIGKVQPVRGRTAVAELALRDLDGPIQVFLEGALGVRSLRLEGVRIPPSAYARLLWVSRLDIVDPIPDAEYCALVERMYRVVTPRAQACRGAGAGGPEDGASARLSAPR